MKMEVLSSPTTEVFLEGAGTNVTTTTWSNGEGVNIMVCSGKEQCLRMAGSLRWEEADLLLACLAAARAT